MATVDGITAARAQEIEDASVVSGDINSLNGHLILTTAGGTDIDAGQVVDSTDPYVSSAIDSSGHLQLTQKTGAVDDLGFVHKSPTIVDITASGSFLKASYAGMVRAKIEIWGAGGGGSGGRNGSEGGGGGGGGYQSVLLEAADLPTTLTCTVGAGGVGASGLAGVPTGGGSSSVTGFPNSQSLGAGGGGGAANPSSGAGWFAGGGGGFSNSGAASNGGTASTTAPGDGGGMGGGVTGSVIPTSQAGGGRGGASSGVDGTSAYFGGGGGGGTSSPNSSVFGGGGGAPGWNTTQKQGGQSIHGGDGAISDAGVNGDGFTGGIPGGGGSGGSTRTTAGSTRGGDGARGHIRITVYYD